MYILNPREFLLNSIITHIDVTSRIKLMLASFLSRMIQSYMRSVDEEYGITDSKQYRRDELYV